ncbi:hypothetical protein DOY81_002847 [Sarcophaga bullata]|nr:hypothetical protein DOY81_002847 [Sarcophaga bullata]
MAAYAAFKHVELYNVGKTKKRVLRPPGGGTSDIFGGDLPQTPRSVKNHMQSHIFSCEKDNAKNNGDQPRRGQKNVDSYQRLFGEPERPVTPAKNHMKSNIPFGVKTEAAQALITNGNGNGNGHYNGKSGSVSSTSSSVSSSTENLKMNGFSKTASPRSAEPKETKNTDSANSSTPQNATADPCDDNVSKAPDSARSKAPETHVDCGAGDVASQTRKDTESNTPEPNSLTTASPSHNRQEPLAACGAAETANNKAMHSRNPITGIGLNGDGVDGNPVTGEGYNKSNDFNHTPTMNGANQIINKNRIPPGGYSSGLW